MSKHLTYTIEGMHCNSCAKLIEINLSDLPGTKSASVSFEKKTAQVEAEDSFDEKLAQKAIKDSGYKVRE